ncbi:RNA-directed DNA polymerase, eukaryota [Tanacetum coccineum]
MGRGMREQPSSNEDQAVRISKSIFVTNFPDNLGSKELWNVCEGYGKVIDVFIPNRRSKAAIVDWSVSPSHMLMLPVLNVQTKLYNTIGAISIQCAMVMNVFLGDIEVSHFSLVSEKRLPRLVTNGARLCYRWIILAPLFARKRLLQLNETTRIYIEKFKESVLLILGDESNMALKKFLNDGAQEYGCRVSMMNVNVDEFVKMVPTNGEDKVNMPRVDCYGYGPFTWSYLRHLLPRHVKIAFGAVYAHSTQRGSKRALWDFLSNLVRRWNGEAIIMGDFNDVRTMDERLGSSFNASSARCFDRFIVSSGLVDVKLEALCLDRHLSDHRPILLREVSSDFGPTPFRFYQSWLRMEGFDSMVEHAWLSFSHSDSNAMVRFKKKLQDLKSIIRLWVKDKKFHLHNAKNSLQNDLISIDKDLERGNVSDDILLNRMELNRRLQDIKLLEVKDLEAFKNHFEVRFQQPCHDRLKLNAPFHNRLSSDQVDELDRAVSRDEIRRAVWNCGENKSPGPDGYTRMIRFGGIISWIFFKRLGLGRIGVGGSVAANWDRCAVLNTPFPLSCVTVEECMSSEDRFENKLQARYYLKGKKVIGWTWGQGLERPTGTGGLRCLEFLRVESCSFVEVGVALHFWRWLFMVFPPRLLLSELDKVIVVANKMGEIFCSQASFRRDVRDGAERQQWDDLSSILNSVVPIVFQIDRLPTRVNLSRRGILLDPIVSSLVMLLWRDVQHIFFRM